MLWRVETSVTFPPLPPAAPIGSVHPTTCRSRSPVSLIRHSVRALGCALVLLATGRAPAQGGPPLVTDDPGTPGPGNWEVNVAATLDRTSLASSWGTPLVDANYGWGERVQLKLEMPFAVVSDADGTRGGIGNPLFGVKWRFLNEETAGVAVSTYPQFGFNLVSSSADRGLVERETNFLLPVSAVKTVGPVAVNVEAGRVFESGGVGDWVWGVALGHSFGRVEALAEVFGKQGDDAVSRQSLVNLGGRVPVSAGSTFLVSGGWSLSDGEGPRHAFFYLGLQLTSGRKSKERGHDLETFDRAQDRDRGRDHAIAVEQRGPENAEHDESRAKTRSLCPSASNQAHEGQDPALAPARADVAVYDPERGSRKP